MKKTTIFLIITLFGFTQAHAQKIRVKKDIVHVDDVALYRFVRLDTGSVFTDMQGDTLVRFNWGRVSFEKTDYEFGVKYFTYGTVSFKGSDETVDYKTNMAKHGMAEDLVKSGVLKSGSLDPEAIPRLRDMVYSRVRLKSDYEKAIANRAVLNQNPGYAGYVKGFVRRDPDGTMSATANGAIVVTTLQKAEVIGHWQRRPVGRSVEYTVYTKNKAVVASINHETTTGIVKVRTRFDEGEREYYHRGAFDQAALVEAVTWLTDNGYL